MELFAVSDEFLGDPVVLYFLRTYDKKYLEQVARSVADCNFVHNASGTSISGMVVLWMILAKRLASTDEYLCAKLIERVQNYAAKSKASDKIQLCVDETLKSKLNSYILFPYTTVANWVFDHLPQLTPQVLRMAERLTKRPRTNVTCPN